MGKKVSVKRKGGKKGSSGDKKGVYRPKAKLHAHLKTTKDGKPRRKGW